MQQNINRDQYEEGMNADALIAAIVEYLEMEVNHYRELLAVMEHERDILLQGRHGELTLNCERKLWLSEQLASVQNKRRRLMAAFSSDEFTLSKMSELIPLVPEAQRENYRLQLLEADALSTRLRELNAVNRSFITEALDSIGSILNIFASQQNPGYNARGGRNSLRGGRILVREV
jgi:flagellar biosynthesis/type III secretory pathway chaperone